jgi:macrocin-O-methyltransferase TylF-like protien
MGLSETWRPGSKAGAFSVGGRLPKVRSNVELVKSFFSETLPPFVQRHKGEKVAFVNIDCDLYSSTKTVLDGLKDMLVPGSIILFDELVNYPGWQDEHEFLAFTEFVAQHNPSFEYLGYVRTACQVAVKIGQTPPQLVASFIK